MRTMKNRSTLSGSEVIIKNVQNKKKISETRYKCSLLPFSYTVAIGLNILAGMLLICSLQLKFD